MSPDRVVFSFVVGWIVLIVVLLVLDWLANPNRGPFRPRGEQGTPGSFGQKGDRARRRLQRDAAVRATLRDAYGSSSLRLTWTGDQENQARVVDDSLVIDDRTPALDAVSHEVAVPAQHHEPPPEPDLSESSDDLPVAGSGWRIGTDPLAPTPKGTDPAPTTIRRRVWKNHSDHSSWSEDNLDRLQAGKAPRRTNPVTGQIEQATIDLEHGRASWGDHPVDPFADDT